MHEDYIGDTKYAMASISEKQKILHFCHLIWFVLIFHESRQFKNLDSDLFTARTQLSRSFFIAEKFYRAFIVPYNNFSSFRAICI